MAHSRLARGRDGAVVLVRVSESPPDSIKYQTQQSYLFSVAIDNGEKELATKDAEYLTSTLRMDNKEVIPKSNMLVVSSSSDHGSCTVQKIRECFKMHADKVGREGVFIFVYHGPGAKIGPEEWSLRAVDFDGDNTTTHITGTTIVQWTSQLQSKPKHIILILDCSLAGSVASDLGSSFEHCSTDSMLVISACSNAKTSFVINTLGHSLFTYFTVHAFRSTAFTPGLIPIADMCERIKTCSSALSFLIAVYNDEKQELQSIELTPRTTHIRKEAVNITAANRAILQELEGEATESTDGQIGSFEFLTKHYNRGKKHRANLHEKALAWLETVQEFPSGPLAQLRQCGVLHQSEVLLTAFCLMMFSLASIQAAIQKSSLAEPNLFIVMYMSAAAAIQFIDNDAEISVDHFKHARYFYLQVLRENKVKEDKVESLFHNAMHETQQVAQTD